MCFFSNWAINWEAVSAVATLLAVLVALGTTGYIEYRAHRRRMVEVRSIASTLHFEFATTKLALLAEIRDFDAAPNTVVTPQSPPIPGTNGVYSRKALLGLSEGLKRAQFTVLNRVADRIAIFGEKDAIKLAMVSAATSAFERNQNITSSDVYGMDDAHAQDLERSMREWATNIVELIGPVATRMAKIANIPGMPET